MFFGRAVDAKSSQKADRSVASEEQEEPGVDAGHSVVLVRITQTCAQGLGDP